MLKPPWSRLLLLAPSVETRVYSQDTNQSWTHSARVAGALRTSSYRNNCQWWKKLSTFEPFEEGRRKISCKTDTWSRSLQFPLQGGAWRQSCSAARSSMPPRSRSRQHCLVGSNPTLECLPPWVAFNTRVDLLCKLKQQYSAWKRCS